MLVFVYGTLKQGHRNWSWCLKDRAKFFSCGWTSSKFDMIDVGFPVVFRADDGHPVQGEIFEVDLETLRELDRLEGEGRMYHRRLELVEVDEGHELCLMYIGADRDQWHHEAPVEPTNGVLIWSQENHHD